MPEFTDVALAAAAFATAQAFREECVAEVARREAAHTDAEARLSEAQECLVIAEAELSTAVQSLQEVTS